MNKDFTPEDIRLVEKYIRHYDKNAKQLIWMRWVILLFAILMIGSSYYLLNKAHEVNKKNNSEYILEGKKDILDKYIDARLEGKEIKSKNILEKYIDARISLLRLEVGLNIGVIFPTILGAFTLGIAIAMWKQHERDKLIAKILRTLILKKIDDENII